MTDVMSNTGSGTAELPVLSIAEINRRYADEWVLVSDPTMDETLEVLAGKVIAHDKDRKDLYRKAIALQPPRFAVLYTGTPSDDPVIIL